MNHAFDFVLKGNSNEIVHTLLQKRSIFSQKRVSTNVEPKVFQGKEICNMQPTITSNSICHIHNDNGCSLSRILW